MKEFEPKLKTKFFSREFFSKYIYIFVVGLCLLLGVSYSLTFFIQNKNIATGSITTGDLTITLTNDRSINASSLTVPSTDLNGLLLYSKSLTIENTSSINGKVKLTLTRTSGLNLNDLRYAVFVDGVIQKIADVPVSGELFTTAVFAGEETINVEVRLWPKTSYAGDETNFNGEIKADVKYLGQTASALSSPAGKYVSFNCDGENCETWQIVKVEDGRLVLTRTEDYEGATSRTNSLKYNSQLSLNDISLITSVSTDNKNVYLAKTVKISGGSGTEEDPYELINNDYSEKDQKVVATITYKNTDNTTFGTQKVYYGRTNYISKMLNNRVFSHWKDTSNNTYAFGSVVNFTSDITLTAVNETVNAVQVSFNKTKTQSVFECDDTQCAIDGLVDMLGTLPTPICRRATVLHTETCSQTSSYCAADGYTGDNTTITYGNSTTTNRKLTTGDAFDCDTNGDGNYTERFYYVSDYFDTDTKTFNNQIATLIYYRNYESGSASDNGAVYDDTDNWHGPRTALTHLPTTSTWSNITLKSMQRAILAEEGNTHNAASTSGGTLPTDFAYTGKSARLITAQEIMQGCGLTQVGSATVGELSTNCKFLFEKTKYSDATLASSGIWLETPRATQSSNIWYASAENRNISDASSSVNTYGVRPVIDVPKGRISY